MSEPPTMQQVYAALLSRAVHPVLKQAGFTRKGRRLWRHGNAGDGWVLIEADSDKYNSRDLVRFSIRTTVWPPGTWEYFLRREELLARHRGEEPAPAPALPHAGGEAPMYLTPAMLAPASYGGDPPSGDHWWELGSHTDVDALAADLTTFVGDFALPWVRWHRSVDGAVAYLAGPSRSSLAPSLAFACAVLARHDTKDPRLAQIVQRLTDLWVRDPFPTPVRAFIQEWRALAGLPEVDLPFE